MLVFSKLSNVLFTVGVALLLTISIVASVALYSGREIVQNKDLVKASVKSESLRTIYLEQVLTTGEGDNTFLLNAEELNQISDEEIDQSIDKSIDAIYEWLEGKSDSPSIAITPKESEIDPLGLEEVAQAKLGTLADFIDYEELNKAIDKEVSIVDFNSKEAEYLPQIYQRIDKLTRNFIIVTVVLSALLIISASNIRRGVVIFGVSALVASAILLLGPDYISEHRSSFNVESIPFLKLPNPDELSSFTKEIIIQLADELVHEILTYGKYLLGASIFIIVISQIAIRRRDIDDEDYDDEEDERPTRRLQG